MPRVDRDGTQLDGVKQRQQIAADVARLFLAALGFNGFDTDSSRCRFRRLLLIEALAVDSVRKTLQDEWPIFHCGQDQVRNARVEAHTSPLVYFSFGKNTLSRFDTF